MVSVLECMVTEESCEKEINCRVSLADISVISSKTTR